MMLADGVVLPFGLDAQSYWLDYVTEAGHFLADPRCGDCSAPLHNPVSAQWYSDRTPVCWMCHLTRKLTALLSNPCSDRDVEDAMQPYTFAQHGTSLLEALDRAGARRDDEDRWHIPGDSANQREDPRAS